MLPFAYYLLKVLICSGLLFGYYWFALRNKRFHTYNRFYLLAAIVLSWIIPLLKLDFRNEADKDPRILKLLTVVAGGNSYVERTADSQQYWDWNTVAVMGFVVVSTLFLMIFLATLFRILKLVRNSRSELLNDIHFIFSDAKGTPFTFFNYIFWNNKIDINAEAGKSILRHELVHVNEKHSADKLFINIILIVGWYNPFFLLMRKELNMLHEFIADQKAFAGGDTGAFALMILNASYANHSGTLTQSFFHSPIKRRLLMLTKSKHPRYSYLRRIMVLPLVFVVSVCFAFRLKEDKKNSLEGNEPYNALSTSAYDGDDFLDTTKFKGKGHSTTLGDTDPFSDKRLPGLIILDGRKITKEEFRTVDPRTIITVSTYAPNASEVKKYGDEGKNGVAIITTKPDPNKIPIVIVPHQPDTLLSGNLLKISGSKPMYLYRDELITAEEFTKLNIQPDNIQSINVYKGTSAIEKFGEKGANGVVEVVVKQKAGALKEVSVADPAYSNNEKLKAESINVNKGSGSNDKEGDKDPNKEVVVIGYRKTADVREVAATKPLYSYRDKLMAEEEFKKLNIEPGSIKAVNVYKGEKAVEKFGPSAVNGVVEVSVAQKPLPQVPANAPDTRYDKVFTRAENPPYYQYGMTAFGDYFESNVRYPVKALENKIDGAVSIQFIVDENGKLTNFKKLSNKGYGLEEEAIRLLKNSGDWKPAIQNGHKVAYQVEQLIVFILPGKQAL